MANKKHVALIKEGLRQAMDQLWDSLNRSGDEIPSPDWHQDVLADRKARVQSGEAKFLTLAELRSRLRS